MAPVLLQKLRGLLAIGPRLIEGALQRLFTRLDGREIVKVIVRAPRLVNLVTAR